jgi:hypothetical protein
VIAGDILRVMEMGEAWDRVQRILVEERVRPTVRYHDRIYELRQQDQGKPFSEELLEVTQRWSKLYMNPRLNLTKDREYRPRLVHEFPGEYVFRSENFNLLSIIFGQLSPEDRTDLIHILTQWLSGRDCCHKTDKEHVYPSYRNMVSEFPLLGEFLVRRGHAKDLFKALAEINNPTIPLVILFLALEDMIALNFTLFSDEELREIPRQLQSTLKFLWAIAKAKDNPQPTLLGKEDKERAQLALQICVSIKGLIEQCRTARHYYLKEQLLNENPNLEIEGDKKKLTDSLSDLGFDPVLIQTLRKAEDLYKPTSDGFDLKSCIGFLRSFIERLHIDSAANLAASMSVTVIDDWDPSTTFLKNRNVITQQQDKLARGLYALLSDEGVHPVMAKREFCRLARNMVIEYGVMFLSVLSDKGFKIGATALP